MNNYAEHHDRTDAYNKSSIQSDYKVTRRYWLKKDEPQIGWWPWGLLPLLGLALLWLWGATRTANHIEEDITNRVTETLQLNEQAVLDNVDASGQHVELIARVQTVQDSNLVSRQLKAMAEGTRCDTWVGEQVCPIDVKVNLKQSEVPAALIDSKVVLPEWHDFNFNAQQNNITLAGSVPDQTIKSALLERAQAQFANVTDRLKVSDKAYKPVYALAYQRALAVLANLDQGTADWKQGVLSINGRVTSENESLARQLFNQKTNSPKLGNLSLRVLQTADTCNTEFKRLLSMSTINFKTSSAEINAQSQGLLRKLAEQAKACPGNLQIEGHTDARGSDEINLNLSQARAESVLNALKKYGVQAVRLTAVGYGETRPVGDNSTLAGRAQNRRIVISIK